MVLLVDRAGGYVVPIIILLWGRWRCLNVKMILITSAELSLTVPITNSLAFLFTVLGDWWVEGKVIGRGMRQIS